MEINPVKKKSISEEITHQILRQILTGAIEPGDRLPPERELAVRFNTNRNTLREAIRNLQTLSLVEARQGDGLIVQDYRESGEINLLPFFLGDVDDHGVRLQVLTDVMRVRALLLEEVVATLATSCPPEGFAELRALVRQQRQNVDEPEKLLRTDLEFSRTLVKYSNHLAYRWLFNTFARLYERVVFQFPLLWVFKPDYADSLEQVVILAEQGDVAGARRQMAEHMQQGDELILECISGLQSMLG